MFLFVNIFNTYFYFINRLRLLKTFLINIYLFVILYSLLIINCSNQIKLQMNQKRKLEYKKRIENKRSKIAQKLGFNQYNYNLELLNNSFPRIKSDHKYLYNSLKFFAQINFKKLKSNSLFLTYWTTIAI